MTILTFNNVTLSTNTGHGSYYTQLAIPSELSGKTILAVSIANWSAFSDVIVATCPGLVFELVSKTAATASKVELRVAYM